VKVLQSNTFARQPIDTRRGNPPSVIPDIGPAKVVGKDYDDVRPLARDNTSTRGARKT
jgi:hypothetical protein